MPSQFDYTLSGLKNHPASAWTILMAFAYSSRWNSRGLENPFYGIWNFVLADLVHDLLPHVLLIPQYEISTVDDESVNPKDSVVSLAQANAKGVVPDFTIMRTRLALRNEDGPQGKGSDVESELLDNIELPSHILDWNAIRVEYFQILLLVEIKKPPTRSAHTANVFVNSMYSRYRLAVGDLEKQAKATLTAYPDTDILLLIACFGEWWSWKIAEREDYAAEKEEEEEGEDWTTEEEKADEKDKNYLFTRAFDRIAAEKRSKSTRQAAISATKKIATPKGNYPRKPPLSKKVFYSRRVTKKNKSGEPNEQPQLASEPNFIYQLHRELNGFEIEKEMENVEDAKPPKNGWSQYILFGSKASNQRLFLIHRFLEGRL